MEKSPNAPIKSNRTILHLVPFGLFLAWLLLFVFSLLLAASFLLRLLGLLSPDTAGTPSTKW